LENWCTLPLPPCLQKRSFSVPAVPLFPGGKIVGRVVVDVLLILLKQHASMATINAIMAQLHDSFPEGNTFPGGKNPFLGYVLLLLGV